MITVLDVVVTPMCDALLSTRMAAAAVDTPSELMRRRQFCDVIMHICSCGYVGVCVLCMHVLIDRCAVMVDGGRVCAWMTVQC